MRLSGRSRPPPPTRCCSPARTAARAARWRMTTALRRAATAAGVDPKGLTPHTARTTAATALLDEGVPLADVQELLGHASPVTTQRYNRGRRKLDGHAAYRMAALLAGGSR
uniref:tyrosine-type recombinase/integrase n=1 Tax=Microtetraspora malaysiensis TaxID=161358 RepID=UPI003F498E57